MAGGSPQNYGCGETQALTDAAVITLDLSQPGSNIPPATGAGGPGTGNSFSVTLGGNRTLNILNQVDGQLIYLYVTQDGTGSRTLAIQSNGTAAVRPGGASVLSTTAGAVDLVEILYRKNLGYSFVTADGLAYS